MRLHIIYIIVALLLAGCSPSHPSQKADNANADSTARLRLALLPVSECLPLCYAAEAGLLDSLGLPVKVLMFQAQADADTALCGTTADGGFADATGFAALEKRCGGLQTVMPLEGRWGIVSTRSLRLKQLQDLEGRVIATPRGTAPERFLVEALACCGLKQGDAMYPQVGSFRVAASMVENVQVDAAILPEPFLSEATQLGHRLLHSADAVSIGRLVLRSKPTGRALPPDAATTLRKAYDMAADSLNRYGTRLTAPLLVRYADLPQAVADSTHLRFRHYGK